MHCGQLQNTFCDMHTIQIILKLLEFYSNISAVNIVKLKSAPKIQDVCDNWSINEERLFQKAVEMRSHSKIPFWSSLMIANLDNKNWSKDCILAANRHNNTININISPDQFRLKATEFEQGFYGINSEVVFCDGSKSHIPMIDFHIAKSKINEEIVCAVCSSLLPEGGFIIDSGNSYHFIGKKLVTENQLLNLLAKSILFTPIVDEIWVAHQIIERSCTLRVGYKNGVLPTVIKTI